MALIGAKGVALITCFLVAAGIFEYLIIVHIHSGQRRVPFSDWDNPKISDGFSKVEVENLEARFKKIKFFPAGAGGSSNRKGSEYWNEKKKEILSAIKEGDKNDDKVNVQAPPSVQPKHNDRDSPLEMEKRIDQEQKQGEDGEQGIMKRAIGKKKEDYSYDDGDVDEHGRPKGKENKREEVAYDLEGEGGRKEGAEKQAGGEAVGVFETAAKALAALSNFKKMVSDTVKDKLGKESKKNEEKEGEMKQESDKVPNEGNANKTLSLFDQSEELFEQNSEFFNGRPMNGEPLVEHDQSHHPRQLSSFEAAGNNIMFTLRTTKPFHDKRLPLLFETWMKKANHSNIFIVTDGEDKKWLKKTWDESKNSLDGGIRLRLFSRT